MLKKEKLNLLFIWSVIIFIHFIVSLYITDAISAPLLKKSSINVGGNTVILMTIILLILASLIDVVIVSLLIHISSVMMNIRVNMMKSFFIASLFNLILNVNQVLDTIVLSNANNLTAENFSTNIFFNPFFYLGLVVVSLWLRYVEKKPNVQIIVIAAVICIYKSLTVFI
ncbi:hypothetical protein [Bacillus altitudinis]|uniref:hypothetical protein n=1 Tax=Bacillus altitudinis TaxID=293387 RepID=UPI000597E52D|nr:hypothetical protein [Bacillus altitudinis]